MSDSDADSSVSMDESSNSSSGQVNVQSKVRSSSSNESSSDSESSNDSSRSGATTPESSKNDSTSDGHTDRLENFVPFQPKKPLLTLEELKSSKYEFWTVSVPGNLNPSKLHDIELSLSKSTKFSVNKEKYETFLRPENEEFSFLLPNKQGLFQIMSKQVSGHLAIVEDVSGLDQGEKQFLQSKKIPELPQNLKRRHPIYGHDFEPKPAKKAKKAKKSKKVKKELEEEPPAPVKEKKKKRNKSEQC